MEMKEELQQLLGIPVDLLTDESVHPLLQNQIREEAQPL